MTTRRVSLSTIAQSNTSGARYQSTETNGTSVGELWVDTTDLTLKVWNGSSWTAVGYITTTNANATFVKQSDSFDPFFLCGML